ncbi:MAG: DUF3352 domain-containing protein [Actinobacteria bacterium]|nr:DUF3352 domain-containing protein [Actinomycetota bacterium]
MRHRFVPILLLAALVAALVAGCGGDSSSAEKDPAEAAPPTASVFVEAKIQPDGEIAENVDSLAEKVAGIENVGALITEEIEKAASAEGQQLDFEKEIEPWLGEEVGLFLQEYDGENFNGVGGALQVSDEGEAESFLGEKIEAGGEKLKDGEYEGVKFKSQADGTAFGFSEGLLLYAQDEKVFKQMIDALKGENLAGADAFDEATENEPDGSVANVYVDIGGLIDEAGQGIEAETQLGLEVLGIEPKGSTALVSLVPGSETLEIDLNSNLTSSTAAGGDASDLLGSLPAGSVVAFATAEYGKSLQQMIDRVDENGIPGQIPPHQFKSSLEQSGIDLESIIGSIGDVGAFVEGNGQRNLGGALVIESTNPTEAQNTVKNLGLLLRATGTPGITAISEGGLSGFSIRAPELGSKPLVVAAGGSKIAISYGPKPATAALSGKAGTLADDPTFKAAQEALGGTPISAFVNGRSAVQLIETLTSPLEQAELMEAKPYLDKLGYVAVGGSSSDHSTTAKIVAGLAK